MKNLIVFILWALVWLVIGGKLGYKYVMMQVTTNASTIVDKLVNEGVGTGTQWLANQYQWQAKQLLDEQKEKLKTEAKKQVTDYINSKINDFFK
jgi:hypothetical protein